MDLEDCKRNNTLQDGDLALDAMMDCASSPAENPWFATQLLNQVRQQSAAHGSTLWEKLRRTISTPHKRFAPGAFTVVFGTLFLFATAIVPDLLYSLTDSATNTSLEKLEIPDELVVADLEIFIAELNSDLWQNENSL